MDLNKLKANLEKAGIKVEPAISANSLEPGFQSKADYMYDTSTTMMLALPGGKLAQLKISDLGNIEVFSLTPASGTDPSHNILDRERIGQANPAKLKDMYTLLGTLMPQTARRAS